MKPDRPDDELTLLREQLAHWNKRALRAEERLQQRGMRIWGRPGRKADSPRQEWAWEHAAEVYRERDLLVRALSLQYPSHLMHHVRQHSGNKKLVVCIHSPAGQMAWTIPPDMEEHFSHLELRANDWDGHKTADRLARLATLKLTT